MNRLTVACLVCILLVCAIFAGWSSHASSPPETARRSAAAEIKELQQQRIELLGKAVTAVKAQHAAAGIDIIDVKTVEREWFDARLDAAETSSQRAAILDELRQSLEELVKVVEGRFANGRCSEVDLDREKARLLEVRIKRLRERQAAGAEK